MDYLASKIEGSIHIIWDNLNIHHGQRWVEFNARHGSRFHFHYTPLHASWVNQIEIWFGIFHRRCLKNSSFKGMDDLKRQIEAFLAIWNEKDKHPFKWSFAVTARPAQSQQDQTVTARGRQLYIRVDEEIIARVEQTGSAHYALAFRNHAGRWEPMPVQGTLAEVAEGCIETLAPYLRRY